MTHATWNLQQLKTRLIAHQHEYTTNDIDHALYPEPDSVFYAKLLNHRLLMLDLIPQACRQPGTKMLDVGGGKGRMSVVLSELGLHCATVDILYEEENTLTPGGKLYIPRLKSYLENKGINVIPQDFYADGLPLADNQFDLAIFSEVIEHLPNSPKPILAEIYRVLVPNGYLILTTPNVVSLKHRLQALRGRSSRPLINTYYNMEGYKHGDVYRGHTREFSRHEVEYMLTQEGFVIVDSTTHDYRKDTGLKGVILNTAKRLGSLISSDLRDYNVILAQK